MHNISPSASAHGSQLHRGVVPRRCDTDPNLPHLVAAQDFVLRRDQAIASGMTVRAVDHRLAVRQWRRLLPGIYLCHPGEPTRRQLLVAALLYAGPAAAIDDVDACRFHGLRSVSPDDDRVYVAVPADSSMRTTAWVVVRRTSQFAVVRTAMLRYVDAATAVIAATRRLSSPRAVLAVVSEAAQRRIATPDQLLAAHLAGPRKNARPADDAIGHVRSGVRSAPEAEFRLLAEALPSLPPLLYNRRLRMPDRRVVCPDALAPDAPLIHETNGRVAHAREDLFDDMQERHDYLTTCGFTVLHNPPRRLYRDGRAAISEFERCYLRLAGTGWPDGVELIDDDD
jgi:hypothetical protein